MQFLHQHLLPLHLRLASSDPGGNRLAYFVEGWSLA